MKPSFSSFPPAARPAFVPQKINRLGADLDNQAAAARAVPSIQSPSIPTNAEIGPQGLFFQTISIGPGRKFPVQLKGDFIYIESVRWESTGPDRVYRDLGGLLVRSDTNPSEMPIDESHREIRWPTPFTYLEFSNRNLFNIVYVQFWCGFGSIRRDANTSLEWSSKFFSHVGPSVVIPANYTLGQSLNFRGLTSRAKQSTVIRSASVTRSGNVGAPMNFSLWLFSGPVVLFENQPFSFLPPEWVNFPANALGKIKFQNPASGDPATSNADAIFVENLALPIFQNFARLDLPDLATIWAVAVADASYTTSTNEKWNFVLTAETK